MPGHGGAGGAGGDSGQGGIDPGTIPPGRGGGEGGPPQPYDPEPPPEPAPPGGGEDDGGWGTVLVETAVGFIPILGQIQDALDTYEALEAVWDGRDGAWTDLLLAGVAWVPGGDLVKGGVRISKKAARALGAGIDAAGGAGRHIDDAAETLIKARTLGEARKFDIPDAMRGEFDSLVRQRDELRSRMQELSRKQADEGLTPAERRELAHLRRDVNAASRQIGELAADGYMHTNFPGAEKVYPPPGAPSRSGDFDQIWRGTDPETGREVWVVVEAKGGPHARLGDRGLPDGTRAQQGTPEYFDSIVDSMKYNDDGWAEAHELMKAREAGNVRYVGVHHKADPGAPANVVEFDLAGGR